MKKLKILLLILLICIPGRTAQARSKYSMPYYIEVELTNQIVTVYSTENESIVRQMICSTGLQDLTPRGTYYLPQSAEGERESWYYFSIYNCYAQYATRIIDNVLFHSIPCSYKSQKSVSQRAIQELGQPASHGCIRLLWPDAKFIAENCAKGTRVEIFKSHKVNEDLRQLLLQESYDSSTGMTYRQYLGMANSSDVLGLSSTGTAVRDLQARLRDLGIFNGEITGEYHGDTVNAVRFAQRMMGIDPTGVADDDFQSRIFSADAPVAYNVVLRDGMSGPAVRNLQQRLADLHIYEGNVDGVYDLEVIEALKRFQIAYGYRIDDVASVQVQKALAHEVSRVHDIFDPLGGFSFDSQEETVDFGRVEALSGIRLRAEPNTHSEVLAHVSNNALVLQLEKGGEWSKVQHGKDTGYVKNEFMSYFTSPNYTFTYTTPDGYSSYHIGHTQAEYLIGQLPEAELFNVDAESEDPTAIVNTGRDDVMLNLRAEPTTGENVLEMLPNGAQVRPLLDDGEWELVDHNGTRGYLMNQFLIRPSEDEGDQAVDVGLDHTVLRAMVKPLHGSKAQVYDADSDDAELLGSLKWGVLLDVIESPDNGWSRISYNGHQGYMRDEDLQFLNAAGV